MYSKNQKDILILFFSQPKAKLHLHEIGRILGKKPGVFQKALNSLERQGILSSERRGNQRLVYLNPQYPLLKELGEIIRRTAGIDKILGELVNGEPSVETAFIYGSYARDNIRHDSDIDLIIVAGKEAENRMLEGIDRLERRILREVNPKFYTREEYMEKKRTKDPFLTEVLSNPIIVLK